MSARPNGTALAPVQVVRDLLTGAHRAHLSTVVDDDGGQPFAVPVNIAVDDSGEPYTYLSTVTDASRHLAAHRRAALVLTGPADAADDQIATASATVIGDMGVVTGIRDEALLREHFLATHPYARYVGFCDFLCWWMEVDRVRVLPGFGRPAWVSAPAVRAAMDGWLPVAAGAAVGVAPGARSGQT